MSISIEKMYRKVCQLVKDVASLQNTVNNPTIIPLQDTPVCTGGTNLGDVELEINRSFGTVVTSPITGIFQFPGFIDANNIKPESVKITYNGSDLFENDPINSSFSVAVNATDSTILDITFTNLVTNPTAANPDWIKLCAIELVPLKTIAGCA